MSALPTPSPDMFKGKGDDEVLGIIAQHVKTQVFSDLGIPVDSDSRPALGVVTQDKLEKALDDTVARLNKAQAVPGTARPTATFQQFLQAIWARDPRNSIPLTAEQRRCLDTAAKAVEADAKAFSLGSGDAGLNLVPEYFANEIISFAIAQAPILGQVTSIPMGTMRKLSFPREKTSLWEPDVYWEEYVSGRTKTETATPQFERVALELKLFYVLWSVPHDLLLFTNTAINAWLQQRVGRSVAKTLEKLILVGDTGSGDPWDGIYNTSGIQDVDLETPGTLTFDDVINLEFSIDPEYWPNARFILNPLALREISKLKDKNDNYIWQPPREGFPGTIHGRPYTVVATIPNNLGGSDQTAIFYGDPRLWFLGEGPYQAKVSEDAGFKENLTWWKLVGYRDGFLSLPSGFGVLKAVPVA